MSLTDTSAATWNRPAGSLSSICMMIASRAAGKSGTVSRIGRGGSFAMRLRTPMVDPARNGGNPVASV